MHDPTMCASWPVEVWNGAVRLVLEEEVLLPLFELADARHAAIHLA
jgi:hypothetical protein